MQLEADLVPGNKMHRDINARNLAIMNRTEELICGR